MSDKTESRYCGIGGQAVLEGIMMKNQERYAVSVRRPDGKIETKVEEYKGIAGDSKWKKLPFIRGIFNFADSLILGMRSLNYSATFYDDEQAEETKADKFAEKLFGEKTEEVFQGLTVVLSFVVAIALFMLLPYFVADKMSTFVRNESVLALLEGLFRIIIFLVYIVAISAMKDIRRVYQYHGSEHKCINCIERGRVLNVENVKKSSRLHKRCGTSFLLFVVLVSVILFFFIRVDNRILRLVLRVVLIPVIAGISYEIIRLAGRSDNIFVKIISAPGMWLQKLTTREPDDDMIEVAIASVEAVFDWKAYFKEAFDFDVDVTEGETEETSEQSSDSSGEE